MSKFTEATMVPAGTGATMSQDSPPAVLGLSEGLGAELAAAPKPEGWRRELLEWSVSRWRDEVQNRPLINKNRRPLDDTWRQVIRFAGGDPDELVGPSHDALVAGITPAQGEQPVWVDPDTGESRVTPRPAPHKRPPSTAVQIDYTVLHKYATEQELSYNELCATVRAALRTK